MQYLRTSFVPVFRMNTIRRILLGWGDKNILFIVICTSIPQCLSYAMSLMCSLTVMRDQVGNKHLVRPTGVPCRFIFQDAYLVLYEIDIYLTDG